MSERKGTKALELWCKRLVKDYPDVHIENMTTSWRNGIAFCALVHYFRPDLIDLSTLNPDNIYHNNQLAFSVAEKQLGIPALLDPEDMVENDVPDRLSILTYLSQFYQRLGHTVSPKVNVDNDNAPVSPLSTSSNVSRIFVKADLDKCTVCGEAVYLAQRLIVSHKIYHRRCFRCSKCSVQLSPSSCTEDNDGTKIWCDSCKNESNSKYYSNNNNNNEQMGMLEFSENLRKSNFKEECLEESYIRKPKSRPLSVLDRIHLFERNNVNENTEDKLNKLSLKDDDTVDSKEMPTLSISKEDNVQEVDAMTHNSNNSPVTPAAEKVAFKNISKSDCNNTEHLETSGAQNSKDISQSIYKSNINKYNFLQTQLSSISKDITTAESNIDHSKINHNDTQDNKLERNIHTVDFEKPSQNTVNVTDHTRLGETIAVDRTKEQTSFVPDKLETESVLAKLETESVPAKLEIEYVPAKLETEYVPAKLENDCVPANLETESVPANLETESVPAKLETESVLANLETESVPANLQTESILAKLETESIPANLENKSEPAKLETESVPANLETESVPANLRTKSVLAKLETESLPANFENKSELETESVPANLQTESVLAKLKTESVPAKLETESVPTYLESKGLKINIPPRLKKGKREKNKEQVVTGIDEYPEHLNPFSDDEDENEADLLSKKKVSTNPFGSSDDEEEPVEKSNPPSKRLIAVNPFWSDGEEPSSEEESLHNSSQMYKSSITTSTPNLRLSTPRKKKGRAPAPPPVISVSEVPDVDSHTGSLEDVQSLTSIGSHNSTPHSIKTPKLTPNSRKKKIAPTPPESICSRYLTGPSSSFDPNCDLSLQSDGGGRRKGPAPGLPLPERREVKLQMSPQELQVQLDLLESQQLGLERQGVHIEQLIRDKCEGDEACSVPQEEVEDLVIQLCELVNEKNDLFRKHTELMYIRRQQRLEQEQADIEHEIRVIQSKPAVNRIDADKAREEQLVTRLVEIVRLRDELVQQMDSERRRERQEDIAIATTIANKRAQRNSDSNTSSLKSCEETPTPKKSKVKDKMKKQFKKAKHTFQLKKKDDKDKSNEKEKTK